MSLHKHVHVHVDYIPLLQEPEAPVRGELGMACDHEGESDHLVQPGQDTPQQVSHHDVVLILTPTVVRVEVDITLTKPMYSKEMVQHTNDSIRLLSHIYSFVDEVVDGELPRSTHRRWHTFSE